MIFIGKNTDFTAVWNCQEQSYTVYKNNRFLIKKYKFSEVETYLN
jgi:hypothetical protein